MFDNTKPYKGFIRDWQRQTLKDGRYIIWGTFDGHPWFHNSHGHTSIITFHDTATGDVETLNSRYTLIGPENDPGHN